ncbi:hypothetical protein [Hyphomonas oceanitis]|nr:hypothetical protein [Hyphomonas oceanitis]
MALSSSVWTVWKALDQVQRIDRNMVMRARITRSSRGMAVPPVN